MNVNTQPTSMNSNHSPTNVDIQPSLTNIGTQPQHANVNTQPAPMDVTIQPPPANGNSNHPAYANTLPPPPCVIQENNEDHQTDSQQQEIIDMVEAAQGLPYMDEGGVYLRLILYLQFHEFDYCLPCPLPPPPPLNDQFHHPGCKPPVINILLYCVGCFDTFLEQFFSYHLPWGGRRKHHSSGMICRNVNGKLLPASLFMDTKSMAIFHFSFLFFSWHRGCLEKNASHWNFCLLPLKNTSQLKTKMFWIRKTYKKLFMSWHIRS